MRKKWIILLAVLPSLLLVLGIAIYPIGFAFYLSMTNRIRGNPVFTFIGFGNFASNFSDPQFWQYVRVTVIFVVSSVSLQLSLGFGLALLLNQSIRGRTLFRVVLLVPLMIPPVTGALMWRVMLADTGPVNYLLRSLGFAAPSWLAWRGTALATVIAIDVWMFTPFVVLILLAGLQSVPQTMYEAAAVDGASGWKTFRMVTLPMVSPLMYLVLLFRFALAMTSADTIFATTAGGPNVATTTLNFAAVRQMLNYGFMGHAASLGIFVFLVVLTTTQVLIGKTRHMWKGA